MPLNTAGTNHGVLIHFAFYTACHKAAVSQGLRKPQDSCTAVMLAQVDAAAVGPYAANARWILGLFGWTHPLVVVSI